jgi:hypothetical protein
MTHEIDRIPVPTNGRGPHAVEHASTRTPAARGTSTEPAATTPTATFTATQYAVGFGIIASLIVLLLGRRRGRGK